MPDPLRVLVAGGGVAGLETLLALRDLAGDRVRCTLLTPEAEFVYRPMAVAEPFARGQAARHRLDEIARDLGAELVPGRLAAVDVEARQAVGAGTRATAHVVDAAVEHVDRELGGPPHPPPGQRRAAGAEHDERRIERHGHERVDDERLAARRGDEGHAGGEPAERAPERALGGRRRRSCGGAHG